MILFLCRECVPYSQEDEDASDDEAIWTKEVACGDGYYADTSDSEIVVGKAKSSDNILVSSSSDYDSGTGSRYCYRYVSFNIFRFFFITNHL